MSREEKIERIVMLIEDIEGVKVSERYFVQFPEKKLDELLEWYEYLLEK